MSSNPIKIKKLYFHKNVTNLTGWKVIPSNNARLPITFNFILSDSFVKTIFQPNNENVSYNCLLLRCTELKKDANGSPLNDCYPACMKLFVNGQEFTHLLPRELNASGVDSFNRLEIPTILNKAIRSFPSIYDRSRSIKLELSFDKSYNRNRLFAFGIFTSTTRTFEEVFQGISSGKKVGLEKFNADLKKFMTTSGDVLLESFKIPFLSSVLLERIKIPFRGRNCNHIAPDDLAEYIKINKNNELWLCRICKNPCTPDDIMIDEFFLNVLKKHPTINEIELYPGMKYKLLGCDEELFFDHSNADENNKKDSKNILPYKDGDITILSIIRKFKKYSGRRCKQNKNHKNANKPKREVVTDIVSILIDGDKSYLGPVERYMDSDEMLSLTKEIECITIY